MQVSNSTGQGSDYRVGTSTGGTNSYTPPSGDTVTSISSSQSTFQCTAGKLDPGGSELLPTSGPCTVEFLRDGQVIASAEYPEVPERVALVEKDGAYFIEAQSDSAAA
jgi:hypothetical protein